MVQFNTNKPVAVGDATHGAAAAGGDGIVWLAVVPGIDTSLFLAKKTVPLVDDWISSPYNVDAVGDPDATDFKIKEFRIVSAGLKLSLVNNSDTNNGYWEAIRVPNENIDFVGVKADLVSYCANATANLIDQPSYCTGKLKDIHKYVFQLKPDGNNHDVTRWTANTDIDKSLDMILIKIVGRASAVAEDAVVDATHFIAHHVSNQEVTYAPTSTLHRFMTESTYDSRFDMATHASAVNIKAAIRTYTNT